MADSGSSGFTQARHALLIGNSRYEDPQLRQLTSPDADVRVLATVLEDPEIGGFNVATIVNESWSRAQVQIARFCMDRAREDVILIYYSGHAFRDEYGKLYFAFRDTESDIVTATGIGGTFLIGQLARCRSKHKILILDSAFSGSILQGATEFSGDLVILAASGPTDYSFEDAGGQESLFTHYVVEGLRTGEADLDGDGNVTFDELLTYAKGQVERKNGRQRPRLFSFAERPIVAAKAARHIFISYSRADKDFATAIRDELIVAGHKAWMDEKGIAGGDDWRIRIGAAIDEAKAIVAILSPEALSSNWVRRELNYADTRGKPILPVMYRQCDIPSWYELQFSDLQRLDWNTAERKDALQTLLESIKKTLRISSAITQ